MVKTCCVRNCDIGPKENVACFRFPNNRVLKRKWIDAVGLSNKLTANSTVCIKHFQEDDYDIVRGRPRLKSKVIPSVFGPLDKQPPSPVITEDDLMANEIDTDLTLNNIRKDDINILERKKESLTDSTNELRVNSIEVPIEFCPDVLDDRKNEKETEERSVDSEKVQNENGKEEEPFCTTQNDELTHQKCKVIQNAINNCNLNNKVESSTEASNEIKVDAPDKDDTLKNMGKTDVQSKENKEAEIESRIENEGSKEIQIEGKRKRDEDIEKAEDGQSSKKQKPNGIIFNEKTATESASGMFATARVDCFYATMRKSGSLVRRLRGGPNSILRMIASRLDCSILDELKDIEDILVNYQIKQIRAVHVPEPQQDLVEVPESEPVFIELAVKGRGDKAGSERDCLMVMESVQVELDPSAFLSEHGEHPDEDCHETVDLAGDDDDVVLDDALDDDRRQDPISLLTSSDEDEVIIEEPHIDTVEVSDETDEDDVPLVKLLKRSKKAAKKMKIKKQKLDLWDAYKYFCIECQYRAPDSKDYEEHIATHSTILHVCEICDYTTASKPQFYRHKRKHKEDRKFKCNLCDYKARHNMSLIYHMKSHRDISVKKKGYKCDRCTFKSDVKSAMLKHAKTCVKIFKCDKCEYETKRSSDLRRHKMRRHREGSDDDDEFVP